MKFNVVRYIVRLIRYRIMNKKKNKLTLKINSQTMREN